MPFFLVTYTSIVEADDEQEAAEKAISEIRAGGQVAVAVKADEFTVSRVVVAAKALAIDNCRNNGADTDTSGDHASSDDPTKDPVDTGPSDVAPSERSPAFLKPAVIGAFAVLATVLLMVLGSGAFSR